MHTESSTLQRRLPDADPAGWYSVGFSHEVKPGQIITRPFFDGEVVVYRTQSGKLHVSDPYCPHMGAHFGKGGTVDGEKLTCPFHGFKFDSEGTCTDTPYGHKPPKKACLRQWPVNEVHGVIVVYYDRDGAAPNWEIPQEPHDEWRPLMTESWELKSHPQETSENSVDIGHFSMVHGYDDVCEIEKATPMGPLLQAKYSMTRRRRFFPTLKSVFRVWVWGLGYSFVEVVVPKLGFQLRNFVLATPTTEGKITLRIAMSMKRLKYTEGLSPLFRFLPKRLIEAIVHRAAMNGFKEDVLQDFDIWNHKTSLDKPVLAKGDGPVGVYRKWARQFYPTTKLRVLKQVNDAIQA